MSIVLFKGVPLSPPSPAAATRFGSVRRFSRLMVVLVAMNSVDVQAFDNFDNRLEILAVRDRVRV